MDNTNLIAPHPSTDDTELAKNLKTTKPPMRPNWFVARWMEFREEEKYGFIMGFVNVPLFAVLGAINVSKYFLIVLALWVYLEVSARIYWHQWLGEWVRGLFGAPETPIPPYAEAVKTVQESPNEMERKSVILGTVHGTNMPVLIPIRALMENIHITGPVGSGKTWMALLTIVEQMIRMREFVTFYCCLKGDKGAMQFLRKRAEAAGLPFHVVTMDPELPSEVFNLLKQLCFSNPAARAAAVLQCLGLNNASTVHGENFWQSMNAMRAKLQLAAFSNLNSFRELNAAAEALGKTDLAKKLKLTVHELDLGSHIASELSLLADVPCLNGPGPELDIMTLIQKPCVVVFLLPANLNKALAAKIRRFLLFTVNASARKLGPDHPPIMFATDECHEALDSTEMPIFKSSRELLITQANAHQDHQDFMMGDRSILPMVTGNSRVAIHLGVRDAVGRKILKETCGEVPTWLKTVNSDGEIAEREVMVPRISSDDFDLVNNTPGLAFVTIHEPTGFAAFRHAFICKLLGFPCSREEFEAFRRMPWPEVKGGVTAASTQPTKTEESDTTRAEQAAGGLAALVAIGALHNKGSRP